MNNNPKLLLKRQWKSIIEQTYQMASQMYAELTIHFAVVETNTVCSERSSRNMEREIPDQMKRRLGDAHVLFATLH